MVDFDFKERCYHCGACAQVCPVKAINMVEKYDKFIYPNIDKTKCISCGKCESVCPHLNQKKDTIESRIALGLVLNDQNKKNRSASGGAFYGIASKFIKDGGYVVGCVWNESMKAQHIITNDFHVLEKMQGSKYVWSDTTDVFNCVYLLLKRGEKVLFSGTPCQVSAIFNYCEKFNKNLYLCTIFCHGNSSPIVFRQFVEEYQTKSNSTITDINFRFHHTKKYKDKIQISLYNGRKHYYYANELDYIRGFFENLFGSESCLDNVCQYKGDSILGDWIIGDFWGYEGILSKKGNVSAVLCTEKGFNYIKKNQNMSYECVDIQKIFQKQPFLFKGRKYNQQKQDFINNVDALGYRCAYKRYGTMTILKKIIYKTKLYGFICSVKGMVEDK